VSTLDAGRLDEAQAIYWRILDDDPADRSRALDEACGDDVVLRAMVERLLAVDERALEGFLEPGSSPVASVTRSLLTGITGSTPMPGGAAATPELSGRVGHYEILGTLGRGGGGIVYEARDTRLDRIVALKVVPERPASSPEEPASSPRSASHAAEREARTLAALNHPAIATIHAREEVDGVSFLVQERIEGRSLREALADVRRAEVGVRVARDVAAAVHAAHAVGVVHRDLKPENVMLTPDGAAKVLDFGIAVLLHEDEVADRVGTPGYMSPEHLLGAPTRPAQDVWSLGCLLVEMASGRPAVPGDTVLERTRLTLSGELDTAGFPSSWPDEIRRLALACLAAEPSERPPMTEVTATLDRVHDALARTTGGDEEASNLPPDPDPFVGRRGPLAEAATALDDHALVTITGMGGSGKTRLATTAARRWLERSSGRVWLVAMTAVTDAAVVPDTVARTLELPEAGGADPIEGIRRALVREDPVLLLLDGCEHQLAAVRALVTAIAGAAPGLRVLATSREPIGVGGERVLSLPLLDVPGPDVVAPAALAANESVQLFVDRARRVSPGLTLSDHNAAVIADLCRRMEGIPLAIELAAARMAVLSPEEILARLDARLDVLSREGGTDPRHRSLRAALDASFELLDPDDRTLLTGLTVFVGGFSLDAVTAVCGPDTPDPPILDAMTRLVARSWVVRRDLPRGPSRYDLLDVVRDYATERLRTDEPGRPAVLHERHLTHFGALVARAKHDRHGPAGTDAVHEVRPEVENVRAALDRHGTDPSPEAIRLAADMGTFWYALGHWPEGQARSERILAAAPSDAEPARIAELEEWIGHFSLGRGRLEQSRASFERALSRRRALGRGVDIGLCLRYLGNVHEHLEEHDRARAYLEESIAVLEPLDMPAELAGSLAGIADIAFRMKDLAAARHYYERALTETRKARFVDGEATVLGNLGGVAYLEGDLETALDHYTEARDLHEEVGYRRGHAAMTVNIGATLNRAGRPEEARVHAVEALAALREMDNILYAVEGLALFAAIESALGRKEDAAVALGTVESLREEAGLSTPPGSRDEQDTLTTELREALGDRAFERCLRRGRRRHWGSYADG